MPRNLSGVPRDALESMIRELDRKYDRANVLRRQTESQCERQRKLYFDEMARADAEQHQREDLAEALRDVRVILRQPGHAEDNVEQALKRLEGL